MLSSVRPLSPVERLFVAQRSRAVVTVEVEGALDLDALATAWSRLLDVHPTLRSRIAPLDGGFALKLLDEGSRPGLTRLSPDAQALTTIASAPLPVGGPVAALWVADREQSATVGLTLDHVVTDGHSALALTTALWQAYAAVVAAEPAGPPATAWPAPISDRMPEVSDETVSALLAERVQRARSRPVAALPYTAALTSSDDPPPAGQQPVESARISLSADRTSELAAGARALETSVHGVVAAALMLAVRGEFDGDDARPLGCLSPIDLRSRVEPPVAADVMLAAVSSFPDVLDVAPGTGVAQVGSLARAVTANLRRVATERSWVAETALLAHAAAHPEILATSVIVSNMGRVSGPPAPAGLRLHDVRLLAGREEYFPRAGRGPVFVAVTAVDGRFNLELPYSPACFTRDQVERVRSRTLATLEEVAEVGARLAQPA